ncbi:hypothetical protein AXG93_3894s1000 [Marchantia polymorpha subsp. ruderalis]|uniref:Uncharacterized protein n=1 Tax=Marchantia polymorpha subsp. ruderalis TaxID=1480154 RepID=A0A176VFA7_MARPO|nr:hypothetical protein AXG93_3894s1000 [Marchantia polymorpha subsp. ruderalis]
MRRCAREDGDFTFDSECEGDTHRREDVCDPIQEITLMQEWLPYNRVGLIARALRVERIHCAWILWHVPTKLMSANMRACTKVKARLLLINDDDSTEGNVATSQGQLTLAEWAEQEEEHAGTKKEGS